MINHPETQALRSTLRRGAAEPAAGAYVPLVLTASLQDASGQPINTNDAVYLGAVNTVPVMRPVGRPADGPKPENAEGNPTPRRK